MTDKTIGDINSDERGSGARYNVGKVPFDLLPLGIVTKHLDTYYNPEPDTAQWFALEVLRCIAKFQAGSGPSVLFDALLASAQNDPTLDGLELGARVFEYGKKKYAAWNWAKGMAWSVPIGCIVRHAQKIMRDELLDDESGIDHFGHIQCNLLMLLHYWDNYKEGDDRPVKWFGRMVSGN